MSADLDATLARLKPGDRVVATIEDPGPEGTYSVSGIVWETNHRLHVGGKTVRYPDGTRGYWLTDLVINKPAPDPEPPIGSVVLDDDWIAWQCFWGGSGQLWRSTGIGKPWTWERLSDTCGPLRVIYTPEVTP